MFSKRQYDVIIVLGGNITTETVTLQGLFNSAERKNAFEWVNAISDIIDDVLDLRANESMYFQPNRDDNASRGIIIRTK